MNKIIHGDCRLKLPEFNSIDMVLTDPPFGISNVRNSGNASKKFSGYSSNKGEWDEEVPADEWVPKACEALRDGGIFACFGTFGSLVPIFHELQMYGRLCLICHHAPLPFSISKRGYCLSCKTPHVCIFPKTKMQFQSHIVWHKTNPAPSIHRRMLTHANEIILVFSKGKKWYFDYEYAKTLNDGKQCHNVLTAPAVTKVMGVTRKPYKLCEQIIRMFCPEGGTVLDPFAGSGAIPYAAQLADRKFVAIEISKTLVGYMNMELL